MKESIFKVGDTVTIKERTHHISDYRCGFLNSMAAMAGKQFKIAAVTLGGDTAPRVPDDGYIYALEYDGYN